MPIRLAVAREDLLPVNEAVEQALPLPLLWELGEASSLPKADPVLVPRGVVDGVALGGALRVPTCPPPPAPPVSVTVGDTEGLPDRVCV